MTDREKFNAEIERYKKLYIKIYGLQTPSGQFDNHNRNMKDVVLYKIIIKCGSIVVKDWIKVLERA